MRKLQMGVMGSVAGNGKVLAVGSSLSLLGWLTIGWLIWVGVIDWPLRAILFTSFFAAMLVFLGLAANMITVISD